VRAIDARGAHRASGARTLPDFARLAVIATFALAVALLLFAGGATPAIAVGQAASGELIFYPCTTCHPVTDPAATATLPNGFEGHRIVLEGHDVLGEGSEACMVCHDDPARDPGKLKALGGGFVDAGGDISLVCATCHSGMYREWLDGIHGREQPTCTSAGCHNPHTPAWIHGKPLLPFVGTGFEVRAVSDRIPFTPLAAYPVKPPVETPSWLWLATLVGAAGSAGLIIFMLGLGGRSVR